MHFQIISLYLLAAATNVAANDVVSLFLPFFDPESLVGKVIGTDGPMTSYVVYQQLPHTAEEENYDDMDDGFTIAQGPSSYRMVYSYADYYESMDCKFKGQSVASCFLSQHDTTTTNVDSIVTTATDMPFFPVTITATESGAASVATNKATATPILATVSTPTVTAASTLSNSASQSSASSSDSPSGTEATASSTGSSNSAMAQVTGKAHWLVGGAAMALALAMA